LKIPTEQSRYYPFSKPPELFHAQGGLMRDLPHAAAARRCARARSPRAVAFSAGGDGGKKAAELQQPTIVNRDHQCPRAGLLNKIA
jgi:hypothetical protein